MNLANNILQIIICALLLLAFAFFIFYEPKIKPKIEQELEPEYYEIIYNTFSQSLNLKK